LAPLKKKRSNMGYKTRNRFQKKTKKQNKKKTKHPPVFKGEENSIGGGRELKPRSKGKKGKKSPGGDVGVEKEIWQNF